MIEYTYVVWNTNLYVMLVDFDSCLVCLSCVCVSVSALAASAFVYIRKQRYTQVSLRLFFVDFRKNLPFESYGVKKPICK